MQLAREMKLRSVPQLHFHYDESVVRGAHLSALIERAVAEDGQHPEGAPQSITPDSDKPETSKE
jgi:ribosome-binding factor A